MAIGYRCAGQLAESTALDREIIKRFQWTRHAIYARQRLNGDNSKASLGCYYRRDEPDEQDLQPSYRDTTDVRFNSFDNVDVLGHDIDIQKGVTREECVAACRGNENCTAYSYDRWNKICFIKGDAPEFVVDARSVTGLRQYTSTPPLAARPIVMEHFRNRSFPIHNETPTSAASVQACESFCVRTTWCIAYTFVRPARECLMFKTAGEYFPNPDADSGAKASAQ
jgi:hypothetical protein